MRRRKLLRNLTWSGIGFAATTASLSFRASVLASNKTSKVHWGYIGEEGPGNWAKLSPEFSSCKSGRSQSPINIDSSAIGADLPELEVNYGNSPLKVINNGHTIQVNYEPGSFLTVDGESYELVQFHFHHPSEHKIDNESFPMELHLVHQNHQGAFAVLGVLLKQGEENKTLESIWKAIPNTQRGKEISSDVTINATNLLPTDLNSYRYHGSLTTPPCSENVHWIVLQKPVEVSNLQVQTFAELFPMNARPVQSLNRRFLLRSQS
ncbi:carbonic anhydrase [Mastigocoleus testarum]|uniref:Carbonic anhydrase n=1 Tax=Mastigocoleus testarum BC008 TaxID=371196 RepID=A0A0V7ZBP0_9CYAN|nr:carbonic anhydrase [Mastigocoleus testarum]KST61924.1 carbonate dehydratase [Mastigocoleus testarum BC008]